MVCAIGRRLKSQTGKWMLCKFVFYLEFFPVRFSGLFPLRHVVFC